MNKEKKINKIFAFFFAISFILNGYSSGITGISLGSVTLIIFTILAIIISIKQKDKIYFSPILLIISLVLINLFSMILIGYNYYSYKNMIIDILKYFLWACMIIYTVKYLFNYEYIYKWLNIIGIILTIYLIIQNISFYIFSFYLPNIFNLGILKPYDDGYANYELLADSSIIRPGSLLSESSFYGNFMIVLLVLTFARLKEHKEEKNNGKKIIFYSLGIILSSSTSAIIFLPFIWIFFFNDLSRQLKYLLYCLISFVFLYFFALGIDLKRIESSNGFIQSLYYALSKFQYAKTSSRLGHSYDFLKYLKPIEKIMGVGIGNGEVLLSYRNNFSKLYMNSITKIIVESGYLGMISFILFLINIIKKTNKKNDKVIILLFIIYLIKGFASGIYFSTYGILFMSVLFCRLELLNNRKEKKVE